MAKRLLTYTINGTKIIDLPSYNPADLGGNKAFLWQDDAESIPSGYVDICSVAAVDDVAFPSNTSIRLAYLHGENDTTDWKQNRDNVKSIVDSVSFVSLNSSNKEYAARLNIGTGSEILAAIPNDTDRDESSFNILSKMKGEPIGVRRNRSLRMEGRIWSRLKHEIIDLGGGITMEAPAFIYGLITIEAANPGELSGNMLIKYEEAGVQGFAGGDKILGIYDFLLETPSTRFAPFDPVDNPTGGGFVTHPYLSSLVPSGFANMTQFRDYLVNTFINGDS